LKFSVDFGMGMLHALNLGDVINELVYQVRPFEVNKGETDRVIQEAVTTLTDTLRERKRWHIMDAAPNWPSRSLKNTRRLKALAAPLARSLTISTGRSTWMRSTPVATRSIRLKSIACA
jgi:hypothetical protein